MKYRLIIRQTMFEFSFTGQGRLKLKGVNFLPEETMQRRDNQLMVRRNREVQRYLSGTVPMSQLSWEQFRFVAAATRFFGRLPEQPALPVWLYVDSHPLAPGRKGPAGVGELKSAQPVLPAVCC